MDKQLVFNTVAKHLLKQGKAALHGRSCRYRTDDGLKCAVGVLIPDQNYTVEMEGLPVRTISDKLPFSATHEDMALLVYLQSAHDTALKDSGIEAWKAKMRRIAADYKLNTEALAD